MSIDRHEEASLLLRYGCLMAVLGVVFGASATSAQAPATPSFTGFSIHQSDAEAGLTPSQPRPDDVKIRTFEGHAYWLRSEPLLTGGIDAVRIEQKQGGGYAVWIHLTAKGREAAARFSRALVGQRMAYVLNGMMIGYEVTLNGPIGAPEIAISAPSEDDALLLADRLKTVLSKAD